MPAWVVPAAIAAGGAIVNMFQGWRAKKANEGYVRTQNEYNSPRSQMARYQAAGLNPGLVYSQGNPGNQSVALSQPESLQNSGSVATESYNRSRLADTQQAVGAAKVEQSRAMTVVNRLQADVLERNPLLNDGAFEAVINSLKAVAREKAVNATTREMELEFNQMQRVGGRYHGQSMLDERMFRELELLDQRFNLGQSDQAIKAQVLNSKEFENAMLEVQKRFITDGDLGPAQILEFIKLLLTRVKAR